MGRLVFTNGCFDLLHVGHIKVLERCRELGIVIVGMNSDKSIRKLKLGRPIIPQAQRRRVLESIEYVDNVILFDEPTPYELIKRLKPDIIVKGGDYTPQEVVGHDLVERVIIVPTLTEISTTKIIQAINGNK